jgi:hypothetical protein
MLVLGDHLRRLDVSVRERGRQFGEERSETLAARALPRREIVVDGVLGNASTAMSIYRR